MKEKIKKYLEELDELYDFYLEKTEKATNSSTLKQAEDRLHDLRISINTIKHILEMFEEEE